jgi:hypothetical protein
MSDLNPFFLAAWLERLESGDIPQAQYNLREGSARCVLGVACDVYLDLHTGDAGPTSYWNDEDCFQQGDSHWEECLPGPVAVALGCPDTGLPWNLAALNDEGWSFERLAAHIREQVANGVEP